MGIKAFAMMSDFALFYFIMTKPVTEARMAVQISTLDSIRIWFGLYQ